ncbi:hypothetical protein J1N35_011499 [Gossypium stocksii]|uniref:Uncharacterized protein n=1 Tax=Gossypium stocksii TaxID=47602 RepID=A0A9D4ADM7_9ROSI|nr:hypothetical protein J1N35_011499 [Gossypium stocksii]
MTEELCSREQALKNKVELLDSCVMSWKLKDPDTENKCKLLERKVESLEKAFKKYQEDTTKNFTKALLELKANLVLYAQVVASPLDYSQVDFNFLKDISIDSLGFNVYNPKGKEWEEFQLK